MRLNRFLGTTAIQPVEVVPFNIFTKHLVGLVLLRTHNIHNSLVLGFLEFKFPVNQFFIYFNPLTKTKPVADFHPYIPELLLIGMCCFFTYQSFVLKVFLYAQ